MLLALTTNPAIDRTLVVPGFRGAEVTRVAERRDAAGGKGLNVVRVARAIGLASLACAPLGGLVGRQIADLAAAEGLEGRWSWMRDGESRICLLITDIATQDTLVVNEQGPHMSPADWGAFSALVRAESAAAAAVSFSGSLMPGVAPEAFSALARQLIDDGRTVYVDISGAPLRAALDLPLALLKVNAHELGDALGEPIETPEAAVAGARRALARGPRQVIVTLGRAGAVAVSPQGAWHAQPPAIRVVSPVGSGDAVLAGAAAQLLAGASLAEALRMGAACGTANALTLGAGVVRSDDLARTLAATQLAALA